MNTAESSSTGWFDADAHVIEPPWIWLEYTAARFRSRVPRIEHRDGADWLVCDGEDLFAIGRLGGLARKDRALPSGAALRGTWDELIVPGAYDSSARLVAMDEDGVGAALLFPTVAMTFYALADAELRWELLSAYNRWLADLAAGSGGRLFSVCMIDPDDLDRSKREIDQARRRGHAAVLVPLWTDADWPYAQDAYDILWLAAAADELPVGFHAFASRRRHGIRPPQAMVTEALGGRPAAVASAVGQLIFTGVFDRVPTLKWFSAENDAGWCAYFRERADTLFARARSQFGLSHRPSEYFDEHVLVTFTAERTAVANTRVAGSSNLMWGSDYPHNVTTWPHSRDTVLPWFDEFALTPSQRRAITYDNAARVFIR